MSDVSVRRARLGDVPAMTNVHHRCWLSSPGMPADAQPPDASETERAWERAILAPPNSRYQLWVALDGTEPVGLAALAPSSDPDLDPQVTSELIVFGVDPTHRRNGHGSRLLTATAESLTSSSIEVATLWLNSSDDESRKFLERAGWGADGAHRRLARDERDPAELQLRQIRMGTDLSIDTSSAADTAQMPDQT